MYWACARTEVRREAVAQHFLTLAGYEVYLPQLRAQRRFSGRKVDVRLPLFPTYCFFRVEGGWHTARWTVAVVGLIMDGERPARVPDAVIGEIRSRERGGLIELPKRALARPGDRLRVVRGPFQGQLGIYAGMRPRERIEVLLQILGGAQRVTLAADAVEAVS